MRAMTAFITGCPQKPNGNMRRAPDQNQHLPGSWMTSRGIPITPVTRHILSARRRRMRGVFTTWKAMYANGFRIPTARTITAIVQLLIQPDLSEDKDAGDKDPMAKALAV